MQYYVVRASQSSPGAWLTLHTCSNVFMYGPFANVWLLVCLTETMQSHKTFLNTHSHLCGRNSFTDWIWVVVTSARRASDSERASESMQNYQTRPFHPSHGVVIKLCDCIVSGSVAATWRCRRHRRQRKSCSPRPPRSRIIIVFTRSRQPTCLVAATPMTQTLSTTRASGGGHGGGGDIVVVSTVKTKCSFHFIVIIIVVVPPQTSTRTHCWCYCCCCRLLLSRDDDRCTHIHVNETAQVASCHEQ